MEAFFRWMHIFAGVIWVGHLYFFNWVNGPLAAILDADTKKKVVPELMPRALFWFRWGAAWTWITGVLLLALVYYHTKIFLNEGGEWNAAAIVMVAFVFIAPFIYDKIFASKIKDNPKATAGVAIVGIALVLALMSYWANFSYRGYNIHLGAIFGTIMAFNVWFRIWPSQQKIITAVKAGEKPDAAIVGLAGLRSRHNTYMSVPLVWTMISSHTSYFAGGNFGMPETCAWGGLLVVVALGWHIVWHCYKKAGKVKGF